MGNGNDMGDLALPCTVDTDEIQPTDSAGGAPCRDHPLAEPGVSHDGIDLPLHPEALRRRQPLW